MDLFRCEVIKCHVHTPRLHLGECELIYSQIIIFFQTCVSVQTWRNAWTTYEQRYASYVQSSQCAPLVSRFIWGSRTRLPASIPMSVSPNWAWLIWPGRSEPAPPTPKGPVCGKVQTSTAHSLPLETSSMLWLTPRWVQNSWWHHVYCYALLSLLLLLSFLIFTVTITKHLSTKWWRTHVHTKTHSVICVDTNWMCSILFTLNT